MKSIDEKLNGSGQQAVAKMVAALPEEAPSMVWRSELNQAILAQSTRAQRRKRFLFMGRPALGLAAACALVVLVMVRPMMGSHDHEMRQAAQPAVASSLEAALVNMHREDLKAADVAGAGINPLDSFTDEGSGGVDGGDDSEADLEL